MISILGLMNSLKVVCSLSSRMSTIWPSFCRGLQPNKRIPCLIRAGNGICEQPNVAAAIEENLGCVFKQVADTNFAKCLRSTISTLKTFNLEALRGVLPKFVECVEPIVLKSCGPVPLNVLKALSSSNICPVSLAIDEVSSLATSTTAEPAKCTAQLLASYNQCHEQFTAKYTFWPTSLINQSVLMDEMCTDLESLSKCLETSASSICEHPGKQKAIQMLSTRLCTNKSAFEQRRQCMLQMVSSQKGAQCLESFIADETSKEYCSSLNQSTNCLSEAVFKECPPETVSFIYEHTNEYLHGLQTSKENSCHDQDLIQYLECEQIVDQFRFKPVAFISNSSKWNEFCTVTKEKYRPCMDALPCRFEPITGASLSLFESLCDREVTHRDQLRFAPCLSDYINTPAGKQCVEPFGSVDLLTRQAGTQLCPVVNTILNCSARAISFPDALYTLPPDLPATVKETGKENKPQFDFSHDTTTPSPTSPKTSEMGHQTEESTPEPEPSPEPQPSPEPEPSATTPQPEPQPTTTTPAAKGNGQKNQSKGNSASREHQHLPYTKDILIINYY
uniref:DUF19 domain-containing protein n=1 Tax=Ditylenchus dipsaci TaxID=166011 RepID=A0A915EBU5_9BILA